MARLEELFEPKLKQLGRTYNLSCFLHCHIYCKSRILPGTTSRGAGQQKIFSPTLRPLLNRSSDGPAAVGPPQGQTGRESHRWAAGMCWTEHSQAAQGQPLPLVPLWASPSEQREAQTHSKLRERWTGKTRNTIHHWKLQRHERSFSLLLQKWNIISTKPAFYIFYSPLFHSMRHLPCLLDLLLFFPAAHLTTPTSFWHLSHPETYFCFLSPITQWSSWWDTGRYLQEQAF